MPLVERAQELDEYAAPEWMSASEAARRLGLHIETFYLALKRGQVPFTAVKVGGSWRIHRSGVEAHAAYLRGEVER